MSSSSNNIPTTISTNSTSDTLDDQVGETLRGIVPTSTTTTNTTTTTSNTNTSSQNTSTTTATPTKKSENVTNLPKDKHSVSKRLQQELLSLMMSGEKGVSAFPDGDNLFKWIGTISGPIGTVYEGLEYRLILEFPNGYPIVAPRVKFETFCFHPNVDENGNICLGKIYLK
jgi:hypothetical protein